MLRYSDICLMVLFFFFFKQKTAYEMPSLVGSEMCIRDSEYDEVENDGVEKDDLDKEVEKECMSKEGRKFMADLQRLSDGVARDPGFLDRRSGTARALEKE